MPYYNFDTVLENDYLDGSISFSSSGSNNLSKTNDLKSSVINDVRYNSNGFISNLGTKNDFNIILKNLNSVGKIILIINQVLKLNYLPCLKQVQVYL